MSTDGFYDPLAGDEPPKPSGMMPWEPPTPKDVSPAALPILYSAAVINEMLLENADDEGVDLEDEDGDDTVSRNIITAVAELLARGVTVEHASYDEDDNSVSVDWSSMLDMDPEYLDQEVLIAKGLALPKPTQAKSHSSYDEPDEVDNEGNVIQLNHVIDGDITAAPMYRDGISTTKTYLILATKTNDPDTYNCICQGNDKIKFYPNKEYFGITEEDLGNLGIDLGTELRHHGYERYHCSRGVAVKLLSIIQATRGTVTMAAHMAENAPRTGKHKTPRRGDKAD